jgi:flagellar hook-basal body complex protein FliE
MAEFISQVGAVGPIGAGGLALTPAGQPIEGIGDSAGNSGGFGKVLEHAANMVVQPQQDAAHAVQAFAQGADGELHTSMLTLERADITLKFFVNMRNKCLEAYREIMHMGS